MANNNNNNMNKRVARRTRNRTACFLVTCPIITDEEDEKEEESLTAREHAEREGDVYGMTLMGRGLPHSRSGGNSLLYTETVKRRRNAAILLSKDLRILAQKRGGAAELKSYNRALRECQGLVITETEPLQFLRATDYDEVVRKMKGDVIIVHLLTTVCNIPWN